MTWVRRILGLERTPRGVDEAIGQLERLRLGSLPWEELCGAWKWLHILRSHVALWGKRTDDWGRRAICVATLNADGHVREAAVHALREHRHPEAVPFALWAVRDWVPQVRTAAEECVSELTVPDLAAAFLTQHRLIGRLAHVGRTDPADVLARVHGFLRSEPAREAVNESLRSDNVKQRLFAFQLLVSRLAEDPALQHRAATDADPLVRVWFVAQLGRLGASSRNQWLRQLIADRSTYVVRRVILGLSTDLKAELHSSIVEAFCSDTVAVRRAARHCLQDWERPDFARIYRDRLDGAPSERVRPGWIAGLGETGQTDDLAAIAAFIEARRPRIRSASLRAISLLDRQAASGPLVRGVEDVSGRVRRVAVAVLLDGCSNDEADRLYQLLGSSRDERAVAASLRVLVGRGGWEAVAAILIAASRDIVSVRAEGWSRGVAWIQRYGSRGWVQPSASILPMLTKAFVTFRQSAHDPPDEHREPWLDLIEWTRKVCAGSEPN